MSVALFLTRQKSEANKFPICSKFVKFIFIHFSTSGSVSCRKAKGSVHTGQVATITHSEPNTLSSSLEFPIKV